MMKRIKTIAAIALGAIFLTMTTIILTGCDSKYRPINVSVEEGYTISWEKDPYGLFPFSTTTPRPWARA